MFLNAPLHLFVLLSRFVSGYVESFGIEKFLSNPKVDSPLDPKATCGRIAIHDISENALSQECLVVYRFHPGKVHPRELL